MLCSDQYCRGSRDLPCRTYFGVPHAPTNLTPIQVPRKPTLRGQTELYLTPIPSKIAGEGRTKAEHGRLHEGQSWPCGAVSWLHSPVCTDSGETRIPRDRRYILVPIRIICGRQGGRPDEYSNIPNSACQHYPIPPPTPCGSTR